MIKRLTSLLFVSIIPACAAYDNGRGMPMNVFVERFPPMLDARYMTGTEATVAVSQSKCVELSDHDIQAAIATLSVYADMQNGADELAGRIANAGGNSYVINGFRWIDAGMGTQLNIDATSFLCE